MIGACVARRAPPRGSERGEVRGDGRGPTVREGRPDGRRNGSPGASNQYRRYFPHLNLWTHAQPHTGEPGTREGERPARVLRATGAEARTIP